MNTCMYSVYVQNTDLAICRGLLSSMDGSKRRCVLYWYCLVCTPIGGTPIHLEDAEWDVDDARVQTQ